MTLPNERHYRNPVEPAVLNQTLGDERKPAAYPRLKPAWRRRVSIPAEARIDDVVEERSEPVGETHREVRVVVALQLAQAQQHFLV